MNIRITFTCKQEQWDEMYCSFRSLIEARAELTKRFPDRTVVWVERIVGKSHNWEPIGSDGQFFQCKDCGMSGVRYGKKIRVRARVHFNSALHCVPDRFLQNVPESIRWANEVRKKGFREGDKGNPQTKLYSDYGF